MHSCEKHTLIAIIKTSSQILFLVCLLTIIGCSKKVTAKKILGNNEYQAISYGGYRLNSRDFQPTIEELKEDMLLLSAMGIKLLRTYNVEKAQAKNLLQAISELKAENPSFEMYVMLGAWIACKDAGEDQPNHNIESERNAGEIERAIALANAYPDIVKILAVGNEAMVKWAAAYYVQPDIILKWVNHLQELKKQKKLPKDLWITSSDNFASWGGGGKEYHVPALNDLIKAVDFISLHTYPMHDTHYNPSFWLVAENKKSEKQKISDAMYRSLAHAQDQYRAVQKYVDSIGSKKPIHIGETGWASVSNGFFSLDGTRACDEYKQALYYKSMRNWTNEKGITCFYFSAFDEPWKDANNPAGSENHFGLFTVDGQAKYAIWDLIDNGIFEELKRGKNKINKTFNGDLSELWKTVEAPPTK